MVIFNFANFGFLKLTVWQTEYIQCICYAQSTDSDHPRILLRKPRTRALRNPSIAHANLASARNLLGSRNQTSAIRSNKPTIDHARLLDCGFIDADGRAALHARSIVVLLPWMAEVWLHDSRRLRADPRFACATLGLLHKSSDPRFAQQNPRIVRIRTLHITYTLQENGDVCFLV